MYGKLSKWIRKAGRSGYSFWERDVVNTVIENEDLKSPCRIVEGDDLSPYRYIGFVYQPLYMLNKYRPSHSFSFDTLVELIRFREDDIDVMKFKIDLYLKEEGYELEGFFSENNRQI